jgi:hypothetical protein
VGHAEQGCRDRDSRQYTNRERPICEAVYDNYFAQENIHSKTGEISLTGLKNLSDDVAEDGDIFKPPAPPAGKYVLWVAWRVEEASSCSPDGAQRNPGSAAPLGILAGSASRRGSPRISP